MSPFYALVAAGDAPARDALARHLADLDVTVSGTAETALGALRALRAQAVHLLVLDAGLPPDGARIALEKMNGEMPPSVVVTSAAPGDGLWAYAFGAVDCIAEPPSRPRLRTAVERARARVAFAEIQASRQRLLALLGGDEPEPPADPAPLVLRSGSDLVFLDPDEVDWIEASGVYVTIHAGGTTHLVRETLRHVEERMDPHQFVRIHRSTILNLRRVEKVVPHANGGAVVVMRNGKRLKMSRSYRERIHALIG